MATQAECVCKFGESTNKRTFVRRLRVWWMSQVHYFCHNCQTWLARVTTSTRDTPQMHPRVAIPYIQTQKFTQKLKIPKCKERERIVDLVIWGQFPKFCNNNQLTYLHFFARLCICAFIYVFICLFVCSFVLWFVRLFIPVVWLTRPLTASNTKRLLYRTLAWLCVRTQPTCYKQEHWHRLRMCKW